MPIWFIVSALVPEFVIVKFCALVWPSTTLPKLNDAGDMLSPGCTPVPLNAMLSGVVLASLTTVTVPVALPALVGVNVTANVAFIEALMEAGVVIPLTAKPVPVT